MMRRAPEWFTHGKARERFHRFWPWALSSTCAVLYFYNREPFDEVAGAVATKIRKPLLKTMEWVEIHDVDPETMALELPPDMIFGPLAFPQQMRFLLAALRADNELADGYLARVLVDHMDLSLDPPLLREEDVLAAGGRDLLDFAVDDFLGEGTRQARRHIFFQPNVFLQLVNFLAVYPKLTEYFIRQRDGVSLVLRALQHSRDEYARVVALRALTLFCFTQKEDGDVERRILQANGMRQIIDVYKQSSGDPTDTRSMTLLLSSVLRHYPLEGGKEFLDADGVQAAVDNLNIARYKGLPQHLRVLHDAQSLPLASLAGGKTVNARIEDADFIPVALGVLETFPEFYETAGELLHMIEEIVPAHATPFNLLEFRALPVLSKFYVRWKDSEAFRTDGSRTRLARIFRMILNDRTCKRCFDPSVASYEMKECLRTAEEVLCEEEKDEKSLQAAGAV